MINCANWVKDPSISFAERRRRRSHRHHSRGHHVSLRDRNCRRRPALTLHLLPQRHQSTRKLPPKPCWLPARYRPSKCLKPSSRFLQLLLLQGKKWSTTSTHKTSLFERLTDDLLLRIFSLLTSSEVAVCGRVCRRWHVLAWQPQLWSTIILTGENLSVDRALKVNLQHMKC